MQKITVGYEFTIDKKGNVFDRKKQEVELDDIAKEAFCNIYVEKFNHESIINKYGYSLVKVR